jgi:penicillin-binding protein 2
MSAIRLLGMPDLDAERKRYQVVVYLVVAVFMMLALRLWYLQLIRGDYYRELSENNRIRLEDIVAPRGVIFDRNGKILVDNRPAFSVAIIPEDVTDLDGTLSQLGCILGVDEATLKDRMQAARSEAPFRPIVIERDMSRDQLAAVESQRFYLPGVVVQIEPKRSYERESVAAHLIGYLGEIDEAQLKDKRYRGAKPGDYLGKYGVEMQWESELNGQRGGRQVEVDAAGRQLRVLKEVAPLPGHNLVLTLDERLQHSAEEAIDSKAGAIIAMDPNNGDILAMVSSPAFDQNQFVRGLSPGQWQAIIGNPMHPLENKAIQGQYPPGSTFKPIVAAAALEERVAKPETTLMCQGKYQLGNRDYRCWQKKGHGLLNLHQALVRSCDVYFYQLGQKLGVDRMAEYARRFGLGSRTLIQLSNEARGLVPSSQWKLRRFGIPWQGGEDLVMAIGQGFLLVTPMQMAVFYAAIANGGYLVQPRVVERVEDAKGGTIQEIDPEIRRQVGLKPETISFLRQALTGVVQEAGGTGGAARLPGINVAGKTGTAQVIRMADDDSREQRENEVPYEFRDHAWFVAYAPAEAPQIVVAVMMEHAGHGGSAAAPLARQVMKEFFSTGEPVKQAQTAGRKAQSQVN